MKVDTLPPIEEESGVTPWFPFDTKPARPGVYQRDMRSGAGVIRFAYWSGRCWYTSMATVTSAASNHFPSRVRHVPWRGLTEAEFNARYGAMPS